MLPSRSFYWDENKSPSRLSLVLFACIFTGCYESLPSVNIAAHKELSSSNKVIAICNGSLRVPDGWMVDSRERIDQDGRSSTIWLSRLVHKKRVAIMRFEVEDSAPAWITKSNVREASTEQHRHVLYEITSQEVATGDDTPARFELNSYMYTQGKHYCMYVTFFTNVDPELLSAIDYIDAFEFVDKGGVQSL